MEEQNQDVTPNSSGALAEAIASSPEALEQPQQQPVSETGTPQQPVKQESEEEGKIPYSRFKEKVDEANWLKQQLEQQIRQPQQQQFQQPTQDPYQGMTAEERVFWQRQREIAREEAEKAVRQISPVIDAGRMELAQMKVQQFRANHPDVRANSPEEMMIAQRIQQGYLPDDAYKAVMWDKKFADTATVKQQQYNKQVETKKQANVETQNMSRTTVPLNSKLTTRQKIEQSYADLQKKGEI